jgi:hypothetical protein
MFFFKNKNTSGCFLSLKESYDILEIKTKYRILVTIPSIERSDRKKIHSHFPLEFKEKIFLIVCIIEKEEKKVLPFTIWLNIFSFFKFDGN